MDLCQDGSVCVYLATSTVWKSKQTSKQTSKKQRIRSGSLRSHHMKQKRNKRENGLDNKHCTQGGHKKDTSRRLTMPICITLPGNIHRTECYKNNPHIHLKKKTRYLPPTLWLKCTHHDRMKLIK